VRIVVGPDGEPWFVASDVAKVLGYKDTSDAIRKHCKHSKILKSGDSPGLSNSPRGITIIPESDVYRLIMRSKMPQAEEVQDWVTTDILPTIRKHGIYATQDTIEKIIADPDSGIRMLEEIKRVNAEKDRIASERDEAVRTKAHISDKKTATAMATASVYKRKHALASGVD